MAQELPNAEGYVNDYADIFSSEFEASLENDLSKFEEETQAEIAVVSINSLEEDAIEEYAVRLFEEWGIGKKEKDNGVLLLISKEDRKIRIEVGYGLEPVITDGRAGRIIRDIISPRFKIENYEEGTQEAVKHLQDYILSGEPVAGEEESLAPNTMIIPLIFAGLILIYLASFLGRTKKFWPGGVLGSGLGVIFGQPKDWLVLALILGAWGLLLDYIFSKNYKKLKKLGKSTGFWTSRGGFGGFGGGSSGGGGASGGW